MHRFNRFPFAKDLAALLAALTLAQAAAPAAAQVTPVGPPTFATHVLVDLHPGDRPPARAEIRGSGWSSNGSSHAGASYTLNPYVGGEPSWALAESNNTTLHAGAHVGGTVQFDPALTPHLQATAEASNLRFWQTGAHDTPLNFITFIDGVLAGGLGFAEIPGPIRAEVRFGLDVVDLAGNTLTTVFENVGRLVYQPSLDRYALQLSTTGATAGSGRWADSYTPVAAPYPSWQRPAAYAVDYFETLPDAYVAPAGSLFGLRWRLEADALVEGTAISAALTADFSNTAGIAFEIAADAPAGATLTEVLVAAPVPEPPAAALLLLGLVALARRRA